MIIVKNAHLGCDQCFTRFCCKKFNTVFAFWGTKRTWESQPTITLAISIDATCDSICTKMTVDVIQKYTFHFLLLLSARIASPWQQHTN
jgi:hypothetical protein